MDLNFFLQNIVHDATFLFKHNVVVFHRATYPMLFFSLCMQRLRSSIACRRMPLHEYEHDVLKAQLSISFLDTRLLYFLGNITEILSKNNDLRTFLATYQGPHALWFFSNETNAAYEVSITLPEKIDKQQFLLLYAWLFFFIKTDKTKLIDCLFEKYPVLDLEDACLLMHYCALLRSTQYKEFMHLVESLLVPEQSLFLLSTHFFAKEQQKFMRLWRTMHSYYPPAFWISFWSDQLFRAACFVTLSSEKNFMQAKQVAYRLPFSFIKKDWQLYCLQDLTQAHHTLYNLDYALKNGASEIGLEIFFMQFFAGI